MGMWSVVVPETADVRNTVTNPSLEVYNNTTGFTAVGGSIAQSRTYARRGRHSLAVTPTSGTGDGVYFGNVTLESATTYNFSVDVRGANGVPYTIYFANTSGTLLGTAVDFTGTGDWQRVSVSYYTVGAGAHRLYIIKDNHASTAVFYVDGLLCAATSSEHTFFDGDTPGAKWDGIRGLSESVMSAQQRQAGRIINLDSYSVDVTAEPGIGAPNYEHLSMPQAMLPGAAFQGRKALPRTLGLRCQVKGNDWDGLHSLRKDLWDAIKPNLVKGDQAFILRYSGANSSKPLDLYCVYDSGLEMANPEMYLDEFTLQLIAYDPYWYDTGEENKALTGNESATQRYLAMRWYDDWMPTTPSAVTDPGSGIKVNAIAYDKDYRRLYVGGEFLNWDGIANADYIAYYDFDTGAWSAMGTGMNGIVHDIVVAPGGYVFAVGEFTTAGGTTVNRVARWTGSAWAALGSGTVGVGAAAYGAAMGPDKKLYVVGAFTTAGGATANRVATWDGSAWATLGSGLADNNAVCVVVGANGYVYVGGNFTVSGGSPGDCVAYWDGSAWNAMGAGVDDQVERLAIAPNGYIYAVGQFANAEGSPAAQCAYWNGSSWQTMGSGLNNVGYAVIVTEDGLVYAGGAFTSAGGLSLADRLALWNGSAWAHAPINLPGSPTVYALESRDGNLFIGFNTSGTAYAAAQTTVANNGGGIAWPVFTLEWCGSGTTVQLEYLENATTGAKIFLNYSLQVGEQITIDFRPGQEEIKSSYYGSVPRAVLRGSDMGEFFLLPGNNTISLFVNEAGSPTYEADLVWTPTYDSVDGAAV